MNFALPLTPERERTREVRATASPVPPYYLARVSMTGARRRPTSSKAVNGFRAKLPQGETTSARNSSQPPHYFICQFTDRKETGTNHSGSVSLDPSPRTSMTMVPKLGGGDVFSHASPPLFPNIVNLAHSVSPVRSIASTNMEKSVNEVCNKELPIAEIEKAREIHQRLIVRMMTSPGDSSGAMFRIEAAFGLSYHCQKNLRYQNRASGEFIARLHAVWLSVLETSVQRDVAELLQHRRAEEAA